jgi:kanamycin kinase
VPAIPAALEAKYADWGWTKAWESVPQVVTYRLSHPKGESRYLKLVDTSWSTLLSDEDARLRWARGYLPVPDVVEFGSDEAVSWLITETMSGVDGTNETLLGKPLRLVQTLAQGLRRFHHAPVDKCPFDFRLDVALQHVERRVANGLVDPERDFHPEHEHLSVEQAFLELRRNRPPLEDLVVCHGDYCFPNVLIEDGQAVGFVDLGELGVADRWWDLGVAAWSTTWNVGPGYETAFLDAYEIEPDPERIAYYRLLYDMAS